MRSVAIAIFLLSSCVPSPVLGKRGARHHDGHGDANMIDPGFAVSMGTPTSCVNEDLEACGDCGTPSCPDTHANARANACGAAAAQGNRELQVTVLSAALLVGCVRCPYEAGPRSSPHSKPQLALLFCVCVFSLEAPAQASHCALLLPTHLDAPRRPRRPGESHVRGALVCAVAGVS